MRIHPACVLDEVAAVLAKHGLLHCTPRVECERGVVRLVVDVPSHESAGGQDALTALALRHDLEFLAGVAFVRAFAMDHDLNVTEVDRLLERLPRRTDDGRDSD